MFVRFACSAITLWGTSLAAAQHLTCTPGLPPYSQHTLIQTAYDVVMYDHTSPITETEHKDAWRMAQACNCIFVPDGSPLWKNPAQCPDVTYSLTETLQHCWSVSGSLTVSAQLDMVAGLFATLGVEVEIGSELTDCKTIAESFILPVPRLDCWDHYGRLVWKTYSITRTKHVAEAVSLWLCYSDHPAYEETGGWFTYETSCGLTTAQATVNSDGGTAFQFTYPPPDCHGPDPVYPPHDGQTDTPCGSCSANTIIGCPNAGGPDMCCGLWGSY